MAKGKHRTCCMCGEPMGFIEDKFYDRRDTCGSKECEREMRNADAAERQAAHDALDDNMSWN